MKLVKMIAIAAIAACYSTAFSATIHVPGHFSDLQAAVNAANANSDPSNTIQVAAGTYPATYQVNITKDLTIVGAGAALTMIVPTANTGGSDDASGWFLVAAGVKLQMFDLTLDGTSYLIRNGIRVHGSLLLEGCTLKQMKYLGYEGRGIQFVSSYGTINDCSFSEIGRIGIHVFGAPPSGKKVLITGNTFLGKGPGDWLDYNVEVGGGGVAEVTHNTFANCLGVASSDGSTSAAILATTFFGPGTDLRADYNLFTNNSTAIYVGYVPADTTDAIAHYNTLVCNGWGLVNVSSTKTVTAERNWWGATDGPAPGGTGDPVWGSVSFTPWLMAEVNQYGLPVDLNGKYLSGSSSGYPSTGYITVTTDPTGGLYSHRVLEYSSAAWARDGTYTPFSDDVKPPRALRGDLRGGSFRFDVNMHNLGMWVEPVTWVDNEYFAVGAGSNLNGDDGKPAVWVLCWRNAGTFRIELQTTAGVGGPFYAAAADESKFRVEAFVNSYNTAITAVVTPLNGAAAGTSYTIGPLAISPVVDDLSNTAFFVGFVSYAPKSLAQATISNFSTTMVADALYLFADDPYVKSTEAIDYRLGMANLSAYLSGFQAFLDNPSAGVQGALSTRSYSPSPFATHTLPFGLQGDGGVALAEIHTNYGLYLNATLAHFEFASLVAEGRAWLDIRADNGAGAPTRFSTSKGQDITPTRFVSNTVVVDDTVPTLTSLTATQSHGIVLNGALPVMLGNLLITVDARDVGPLTNGSGLAKRPLISIPEFGIVNQPMYSGTGNTFCYDYTVTSLTPCGVANITITAEDDAGNAATPATGTLTVNTTNVSITVALAGGFAAGPVTREILFTVGGTGGINSPITVAKNVTFTSGVGTTTINALDTPTIPCGAAITHISAKDRLHTLRQTIPLGGSSPSFTASFTGGDALIGGDANDDDLIDILDFGMLAWKFGTNFGTGDTPIGNPYNNSTKPHPDFSGNGLVGTEDYTFISSGFLTIGDAPVGNYGPQGTPKEKATVKEMLDAGIKIAPFFDLNRDGWVTYDEIATWLSKNHGGGGVIGRR